MMEGCTLFPRLPWRESWHGHRSHSFRWSRPMPGAMSLRVDLPQEVLELPYFHSDITTSDQAAERLRRDAKAPCSFLFRPSSKGSNFLSISVCIPSGEVRHVNITISNKQGRSIFFIVPEVQFDTIRDLRQYYGEHRICNMEMIDNIRLEHEVPYPVRLHYNSHGSSSSGGSRGNSYGSPPFDNFMLQGPGISPDLRRQDSGSSHGSQRESGGSQGGLVRHSSSPGSVFHHNNSVSKFGHRGSFDHPQPGFIHPRFPSGERSASTASCDEVFTRDQGQVNAAASPGQTERWTADDNHMPPPLPSPSRRDDRAAASGSRVDKKEKKKEKKKDKAAERPPMPLPVGNPGENPYYSRPRNETENRLPELKKALIENDRCECGLRLVDAELPLGWTLHRVRELPMMNRPFFQDKQGGTRWTIPEEVVPLLTPKQHDFIKEQFLQSGMPVPPILLQQPGCQGSEEALLY